MLSWPPFPISNLEFTVGWGKPLIILKKVKCWFHKYVVDQEDPHCQSKSQMRSLLCRTKEGALATFRSMSASFLHWFLPALALWVNKPPPRRHWSCLPDVNHWFICLKFSQKGRGMTGGAGTANQINIWPTKASCHLGNKMDWHWLPVSKLKTSSNCGNKNKL